MTSHAHEAADHRASAKLELELDDRVLSLRLKNEA